MSEAALANARDWYPSAKDQLLAGKALIAALSVAGNVRFTSGNISGARPILAEAVEKGDQLLQRRPSDDESAFLRARAGQWYAAALSAQGDYRGARKVQESSQAILDRLLAREPNNTTWRALRARMATSASNQYRYLAEQDPSLKPKALDAARDAYTLAIANARQNPDDKSSVDEAVVMTTRYATQLARENRRDLSMPLLHEAGALTDRLAVTDPSSRRNLYLQMNNRVLLGAVANDAGDPQAGLRYDTEAEQMAERLLARWPTDLDIVDNETMILMNQAIALRHLNRVEQARGRVRKALDLAAMLIARKSGSKNPVTDLEQLRYQAHMLGLPDVTQTIPIH
jgi:tetratricopeptide (TPR) repeat protein